MWKWLIFAGCCAFVALEVYVLLIVGGWLGVGWTLVWMASSALLGIMMVRVSGLHAMIRIHRRLREQELPTNELLDMAMILAGGLMLIAPGFVSDAIGLALALPPVRWLGRQAFCLCYGEYLPGAFPDGRGRSDDVIEIRPEP